MVIQYFFSKSGRVSRSKFWLLFGFLAGLILISTAAIAAFEFVIYGRLLIPKNMDLRLGALCLAFAPLYLMALAGIFTVPIKRLHDRNHNGWWLIFYILAPIILFTLADDNSRNNSGDTAGILVLELIGLGIWIAAIVQLGLLPGTPGDNYYGEEPLADQRK